MNDLSFMEFCKDLHKRRWFKKHWLWIDLPQSHYSFIKEHYVFEKYNELYKGILHCIWYDKKETFKAVVLDNLTYEELHTIIPERECHNISKVYLLTHVCFNYENLHK